MEKDEAKRTEIEDRIIAKASDVQLRETYGKEVRVDFDQMEDFLDLCVELVRYFQQHADTTIGVDIVKVYSNFTKYFRHLNQTTKDEKTRQTAQRWLNEIEGWMDDIITEAGRNWGYLNSER